MSSAIALVRALTLYLPMAVATAACAAAVTGSHGRINPAGSLVLRQIAFERRAVDLRVEMSRFDFDSCPATDDAGNFVWTGVWSTDFDYSLWPLVMLSATPLVLVTFGRRGSRPPAGFPLVATGGSLGCPDAAECFQDGPCAEPVAARPARFTGQVPAC